MLDRLNASEPTEYFVDPVSSKPLATKLPRHLLVASGAVVDFRMPGVTRFKN